MTATVIGNGVFYNADCFDVMPTLGASAVDMVLCDLPYGTTQNKWDSVLDLKALWRDYWRLAQPNAAVVLTAAQPFTSVLVCSELKQFRYDWTWKKEKGTGHLDAKKRPMRDKEDILVFYKAQPVYNPQFTVGTPYNGSARVGKKQQTENYNAYAAVREDNDGRRYPKQVQEFQTVGRGGIHPTQKPVALFEYLIRTYTNEGALILDNCAGSGTTAIAAENTGRRWVCIEKDPDYAAKAIERIRAHVEAKRVAA